MRTEAAPFDGTFRVLMRSTTVGRVRTCRLDSYLLDLKGKRT